jgi:hypothetical protein
MAGTEYLTDAHQNSSDFLMYPGLFELVLVASLDDHSSASADHEPPFANSYLNE